MNARIILFAIAEGWRPHADVYVALKMAEKGIEWWDTRAQVSVETVLDLSAEDALEWLKERIIL